MENRTEIPEATSTEPDLSDADETLEIFSGHSSDPVIRTLEVTEEDILEVRAAVAAMEAPMRTEPTQIIPRAALAPKKRAWHADRANKMLMLAAAVGTWAFFASLAGLGAWGAYSLAHSVSHSAEVAATPPSAIELASIAPARTRFIAGPVAPRAHALESSEDTQASEEPRASSSHFGILRFTQTTNGALIDGAPRRVTGDALLLSCGAHKIRTARAGSRVVRVPCGKTVVL